jgi:3-hydroxyacyl-[acyl-carrier-protein] dehydratase
LNILLNDFFEIINLDVSPDKDTVNARIKISPDHKIFNGHFPDFPVVPGVCMIQMIKETLSEVLDEELFLVKGDNIKFLKIITPIKNRVYNLVIRIKREEKNTFFINSDISFENTNYCSFKGTFIKYTAYQSLDKKESQGLSE